MLRRGVTQAGAGNRRKASASIHMARTLGSGRGAL